MKITPVLFSAATWARGLANPLPTAYESSSLNIELQYNKLTAQSSITAWNKERTEVFGYSCSDSLTSGVFRTYPISFKVDQDGAGNITVDSTSYIVHDSPESSGGITCSRMYSETEALVACAVQVPEGIPLVSLDQLDECFSGGGVHQLGRILRGLASGSTSYPGASSVLNGSAVQGDEPLERRQWRCPGGGDIDKRQRTSTTTEMVGDGNPHQNYMNVQLSWPMNCGLGDCEVGYTASKSYSVGWEVAGAYQWISGGFAVSMSEETGNQYSCSGGREETVCIWKNQAMTAYTVRNVVVDKCDGNSDRYSDPSVMWSPNKGGRGSSFYCVHGKNFCGDQGQRWLDKNGRAGGP